MEINRDSCTFCKNEPDELPQTYICTNAHGALGLKYLIFCQECIEDGLEDRYEQQRRDLISSWATHLDPKDDHMFTKKQMLDMKMSDVYCNGCGHRANEDSQWTLESSDDIYFFFLCNECAKKHESRMQDFATNFIEDNSAYFQQ